MTNDSKKIVDWLCNDLKIALRKLNDLKELNKSNLFTHVRKSYIINQKDWELSCIYELVNREYILFDDTTGEIILESDKLPELISDKFQITEIVLEAISFATGDPSYKEIAKSVIELKEEISNPIEDVQVLEQDNIDSLSKQEHDHYIEPSDDLSDLSWDESLVEWFSPVRQDALVYVRQAMHMLASGGQWKRTELFPKPYMINEDIQRKFLDAAVADGLIEVNGENRWRKYHLNKDRIDYDSLPLIAKLVYPDFKAQLQKSYIDDFVTESDADKLLSALIIQTKRVDKLFSKVNEFSIKIDQLVDLVTDLSKKTNGK